MEENNQSNPLQIIGFVLIAGIITWMLYNQQVNDTENKAVEAEQNIEQTIQKDNKDSLSSLGGTPSQNQSSTISANELTLDENKEKIFSIENDELKFEISSKGGQVKLATLKNYTNYKDKLIDLVNQNQSIEYSFATKDGRFLNSADFNFSLDQTRSVPNKSVVLTAYYSENQFIQFTYTLAEKGFMLDFSIETFGMENVINTRESQQFKWYLKAFRNSKSVQYENRYTELTYGLENGNSDYLSNSSKLDEELAKDVNWISYRQHFFTSILAPQKAIGKVNFTSENLVESDDDQQNFTKVYVSEFNFPVQSSVYQTFRWYYGPASYQTLKEYGDGFEKTVYYGWGIFGWINRAIFIPFFDFLTGFLSYGMAIIVLTIVMRLVMSPVTYKSYVSQAKMKVLKPEIDELNKKYKDNAAKKQQETMALYTKAGANPMSGCLPALLQIPVFYSLFYFFPVAFVLRQKNFLWADDLASYDSIAKLPFSIPFYGDHVSLFPILASIAIFFYTTMTMPQQNTSQPGMPNMKFIMYLMPVMMLFFFNNYASGLSLYYFISNLLTIVLMLIIKKYIVSDEKIRAKIEENKKKPKKKGGFSAKLQKAMEQAEQQKRLKNK